MRRFAPSRSVFENEEVPDINVLYNSIVRQRNMPGNGQCG